MTDEEEDEDFTNSQFAQTAEAQTMEKGDKCYYLKSDSRSISELAFEETNSYINQYNLQLPL
jgi:hypothetical protein